MDMLDCIYVGEGERLGGVRELNPHIFGNQFIISTTKKIHEIVT